MPKRLIGGISMYYVVFDDDRILVGVFEQSSDIDESYITIDEELYQYIMSIHGRKKFNCNYKKTVYTIEDAGCFECIPLEPVKTELELLQEETVRLKQELQDIKSVLDSMAAKAETIPA